MMLKDWERKTFSKGIKLCLKGIILHNKNKCLSKTAKTIVNKTICELNEIIIY
jgi:hypothetical protein